MECNLMASSEIECECDCGCPDEICECDDCECEHADLEQKALNKDYIYSYIMRRDKIFKCVECGTILPPRYKGRQRIYCGNTCRKNYTSNRPLQDMLSVVHQQVNSCDR